jgi:hypothetical protein
MSKDQVAAPAAPPGESVGASAKAAVAGFGQASVPQMEQGVMSVFQISDAEFVALAMERARQVQTNLVQDLKVDAARVLLSEPGPGTYPTNGHRVNLQLR